MNWFWSIIAALLAALTSGAASIGVGLLCVRWYRISSFEGKSGFAVAGICLLGAITGLLVGAIASRLAAGHGPFSQVLWALGASLAVIGAAAALAFLGSLGRP